MRTANVDHVLISPSVPRVHENSLTLMINRHQGTGLVEFCHRHMETIPGFRMTIWDLPNFFIGMESILNGFNHHIVATDYHEQEKMKFEGDFLESYLSIYSDDSEDIRLHLSQNAAKALRWSLRVCCAALKTPKAVPLLSI